MTFFGVRGSTPCHGPELARYGGNTSCVAVDVPGQAPILLDIGTGARYFGLSCREAAEPFHGHCLVTHLHWDHVQGLPFFPPILRSGGVLELHAPVQERHGSLREVIDTILCPPLFPVGVGDLPGEVRYHEHGDDTFAIGAVQVTSRFVPHIGNTLGYRLDVGGRSVAYISDHQQPGADSLEIDPKVLELCGDADLVIHDAQYTAAEFPAKATWGHCTDEYAIEVARAAGARAVALYHHDPMHDDDHLDALAARHRGSEPEVIVAREQLSITVGP